MPCEDCPPPQPAKEVVAVKVWYDDATYTDPDWSELPDDGVQVIVLVFADGTSRILMGNDYYYRADGPAGVIYGQTDKQGDLDEGRYRNLRVIRGRTTDDATLQAIIDAAMAWSGE